MEEINGNGCWKRNEGSTYGLNYTPTLGVIFDPPRLPLESPPPPQVFPASITRNA